MYTITWSSDTPLVDKAEDAYQALQTALEELAKTPPDNQAAIGNIEGAVGDLEAAVKDELLNPLEGKYLMDQLAQAARQLAANAIAAAEAQPEADMAIITEAKNYLDEGNMLRASGAYKDAVNKYKDALAKAETLLT